MRSISSHTSENEGEFSVSSGQMSWYSKTLMRNIEYLIVAHGISDDVEPFVTGWNILEDYTSFQFSICLNLIYGRIGVDETDTKIISLQVFWMVDIILITTFDVTSDFHLKDVEDGFAMVMETTEGEIIIVPIAQSTSMPEFIYLLIGQSAISPELFYQPYVTAKYICCHTLFVIVCIQRFCQRVQNKLA